MRWFYMWILVFSFELGAENGGAGREGRLPEGTLPSRALLMQTIRPTGRQQGPSPGLLNAVLAGRQASKQEGRQAAWAARLLNPSSAEPRAGLSTSTNVAISVLSPRQ